MNTQTASVRPMSHLDLPTVDRLVQTKLQSLHFAYSDGPLAEFVLACNEYARQFPRPNGQPYEEHAFSASAVKPNQVMQTGAYTAMCNNAIFSAYAAYVAAVDHASSNSGHAVERDGVHWYYEGTSPLVHAEALNTKLVAIQQEFYAQRRRAA
jgi:hypothetical protein